jgi:hypothetical protein
VAEQLARRVLRARDAEVVPQGPERQGAPRLPPAIDGQAGDEQETASVHQLGAPARDLRSEAGQGEAVAVDRVHRQPRLLDRLEAPLELLELRGFEPDTPEIRAIAQVGAAPGSG